LPAPVSSEQGSATGGIENPASPVRRSFSEDGSIEHRVSSIELYPPEAESTHQLTNSLINQSTIFLCASVAKKIRVNLRQSVVTSVLFVPFRGCFLINVFLTTNSYEFLLTLFRVNSWLFFSVLSVSYVARKSVLICVNLWLKEDLCNLSAEGRISICFVLNLVRQRRIWILIFVRY